MKAKNVLLICVLTCIACFTLLVSCNESGDIPYEPQRPISMNYDIDNYSMFSVDKSKEWTWTTDEEAIKEVSYPLPHYEHPSYKKMIIYEGFVFDENGNLKYMNHPLVDCYQNPSIIGSVSAPTGYLDAVKLANAYRENRYDIQDNPDAEYLEWLLGLREKIKSSEGTATGTDNPFLNAINNEMAGLGTMLTNPTISNWLEQVARDENLNMREEYKYLYDIQRYDEKSFDYVYLDKDGKTSYTIRQSLDWNGAKGTDISSLLSSIGNIKVKHKIVENPVSVSINLNEATNDTLRDEMILAYKFNKAYNYPDGWKGFKRDISKILRDSIELYYEQYYREGRDFEDLVDKIERAISDKRPVEYDTITGEVDLGFYEYNDKKGKVDLEYDIYHSPDYIGKSAYMDLKIEMVINSGTVTSLQVYDNAQRTYGYGSIQIFYEGKSGSIRKINDSEIAASLKKQIKLTPKINNNIDFISFILHVESSKATIARYFDLLKKAVNNQIGGIEVESEAYLKSVESLRENAIVENTSSSYDFVCKRVVTEEDLRNCSKKDLRIMRNWIYARHGYKFKSQDLQEYFSQFDWYSPRYTDVTSQLSEIELKNVDFISRHE